MIWALRILVILSGPAVGWFYIQAGPKGILVGTAAAVAVIGVEILIERIPLDKLIAGALGAILGLIAALVVDYVATALLREEEIIHFLRSYSLLIKIAFCYVGLVLAVRKWDELSALDRQIHLTSARLLPEMRLVDASAIIDGRIRDLAASRIFSGALVVPSFVIAELQALADSADETRRARGRRGLEVLEKLQENSPIPVKILDRDYPNLSAADEKLLRLAEENKAAILTTDFNLSKAASLHGVHVINLHELATLLKPPALPGESLTVFIQKEGKEPRQGVAYLDDGTMVVVENGRSYVGRRVEVSVNNVLQTSAGRMVFAQVRRSAHPS